MDENSHLPIDAVVGDMALDPESRTPLHRQLETALRASIRDGRARPGSILPGENDLVKRLGVSRHTVRHALGALAADGLLRRQRGFGTTVVSSTPPPVFERSLGSFYAFVWEAEARGAEHRSRLLQRSAIAADRQLADAMGVPPGTSVERIVRLRTAEGEPLVLEVDYLPSELGALIDQDTLERESLYDALERRAGLAITGAREKIQPVILDRDAARLLGVTTGSAAFAVERTTWAGEQIVEWQRALVRGDRYLYSVELPRHRADGAED